MKRASYNSLNKEDTVNTILIVASRTVSRYTCREVRPFLNYDYKQKLQPSKELLEDWKENNITEDEYIKRYFMQPDILKTINELVAIEKSSGKEVVLLCHCGKDKFCHTILLLALKGEEYLKS